MDNNLELTGKQKAATLLITLGPEAASHVLKHFEEEEIETLTYEISQMGRVAGAVKEAVIEECYHMSFVSEGLDSGGFEYARDMLARALGSQKAREFM